MKGDIAGPEPVPVRMHALSVLDDVLGDRALGRSGQLQAAMRAIGQGGRGVVVLIREPRATSLSDRVRARFGDRANPASLAKAPPDPGTQLRDYGVGAQILLDLGVRDMVLLTNARRAIVGLEGYGLNVVGHRPL